MLAPGTTNSLAMKLTSLGGYQFCVCAGTVVNVAQTGKIVTKHRSFWTLRLGKSVHAGWCAQLCHGPWELRSVQTQTHCSCFRTFWLVRPKQANAQYSLNHTALWLVLAYIVNVVCFLSQFCICKKKKRESICFIGNNSTLHEIAP